MTHRISRTLTAAALAGAVLLLPGLASAAPAGNDPLAVQSGELVVNGGAEDGTNGWSAGLVVRPHGSGGYPGSVIVDSGGATGATFAGGGHLFSGNGAESTSTQEIDLSPSAGAIDSGMVTADVSAYLGGYSSQADRAEITFEFRDASSSVVESRHYGPVTNTMRGNTSGFIHSGDEVALPAGTRSVLITIHTVRSVAPANDGYVDNVSVTLSAPGPDAVDDTANTAQDTPVTLDPASNDSAVGPATIDPTSVLLLDGGTPVTTLTNADGTYTVDTTTGEVTFTPAPGFTGTTTPVDYQVTDSNGQPATASITITVGPIVDVPVIDGTTIAILLGGTAVALLGVLGLRRYRAVQL